MDASELLESRSTDCRCLTTAGSGAVAGLNLFSVAKMQTLELTGMNGSAVVSPGCGCRPSADTSIASDECHCKSGVDIENHIPGEHVAFERIDYQNTFVANNKFRSNENQMRGQDEEKRPKGGCCGGSEVASQPSFDGQSAAQEGNSCCIGVATSRSENLLISHKPIMAGDK